ncbi:MAG: DUF21 domain-containing protein [Phycisphaerae bacterium]|nr:DUF21 domain-containing protein [Phycisphaerae bacterium]NIV14050.1 DUF21 domain-containing protein [Fodinibius sp.]NIW92604.1 DUF21 domain-containing protein [Phycisphaerae bacterium]
MFWLMVYLALALGISFICSLLEATMLSMTPAYVEMQFHGGKRAGRLLRRLQQRIDRPLIAILTLNTIANTFGAMGVGTQVYKVWTTNFGTGFVGRAVAISSGLLTLGILVFSEIIPKTLGAVSWKRVAPTFAYIATGLIYLLFPFILLFEWLSGLISYGRYQQKTSLEELMQIALIGKREGTLVDRESKVIMNLLKLRKIKVADVMTPRNVVTMLARTMPVSQIANDESALRYSRLPVYGQGVDDIVGVVHRYDIFKAICAGKGDMTVGELCSEIHAVPELGSVSNALDEFIGRREHILLVMDEYGGVSGILTLEDAIETLLGIEIVDEYDEVEDMRMLALRLGKKRRNRMLGILSNSIQNKNNSRTKTNSNYSDE